MNQLASNLRSGGDKADRGLSLQAQRSHRQSAAQNHQPQQHQHFVQAQAQFQQFSKQQRESHSRSQKADHESPVSPLQLSSETALTPHTQRQSAMLTVPSLDLGGLYRQNLGNSQSFAFQQQNQIPTLAASTSNSATSSSTSPAGAGKDQFHNPYDGQGQMDTSSTDISNDPEDSSNMIAGIITKICFDLSSENQQQLQIAHSVGLRVYEALSRKMNQYRLELQSLRRVIEEKDRRIQLLESLQHQTRQTTQMQMAKFAATPPSSGVQLSERTPEVVASQKQFNVSHGAANTNTGFSQNRAVQSRDETAAKRKTTQGTRRKAQSSTARSRKKAKTDAPKARIKGDATRKKKNGGDALNRWTKEQDTALKNAVRKYDGRNWKAIAQLVDGRDHVQCLQRWKKVLQPGLVKGHWTPEEDEKLLRLIQDKEMHSWAMVAENIEGRTAKQCRERWSLNLDPSINRSPWTVQEDALLLKLYAEIGGKWAEIKQQFDGRTENAVKTRYKSIMRAKAREWTQEQDQKLVELRKKFGKDWARIAKGLPGRSKNAIKVRCKTLAESNPVMRSLEYPHLENAPTLNMGLKRDALSSKSRKKITGI